MPYRFVDDIMKNMIDELIINEFPNMIAGDRDIIKKYFTSFIEVLSHIFKFSNNPFVSSDSNALVDNKYELNKDNNLNLRWLLYYILPYINESNGYSIKDISSLSEIYTKKMEDVNINEKSPQYVYSNIQYGRCVRDNINDIKEKSFSEEHIRDNYYLLISTMRDCSNKMHVNWKDILPYTYNDLLESKLYRDTKEKYDNNSIHDWDPYELCNPDTMSSDINIDSLNKATNGLYVGIIYDTISNLLYESILDIKWMIYDIPVSASKLHPVGRVPIIIMMSHYLNLTKMLEQSHRMYWDDICKVEKEDFIVKWENIKNAISRNTIVPTDEYSITPEHFSIMIKSLLIGFNYGYKHIELLKLKGYISFKQDENIKRLIGEEDLRLSEIDISYFIGSMNSIKCEHLYNYLVDSVFKFKKTWYSRSTMNVEKTKFLQSYYVDHLKDDIYISQKNVYNLCKSLLHYNNSSNEYVKMPRYWRSLSESNKMLFMNRLNNRNTDSSWFSIKRYIKSYMLKTAIIDAGFNIDSLSGKELNDNADSLNQDLFEALMKELIHIVFDTLLCSGILTYFSADHSRYTVNGKEYLVDVNRTFSESPRNKFWEGSYHYLTDKPYKCTGTYKYNVYGDYVDLNTFSYNKLNRWYERVSMHWIAQLGLCHKIIHQRVHYITGGTGIGKSSIIPILYMYYLKSLDYNTSGSVVCTQPRIQPTKDSAMFTSSQMGLPITHNHETYNKNYNFQMVYKEYKHMDTGDYLRLRFSTDGSLLMDLKNPMLKTQKSKDRSSYTPVNMYDVVIVDEAHEHNANMDIIISLMRNICHYNNSIKIVIMSATIDSDESTYRRYYRNINDNRKYPLDKWIEKHTLDRINIDRRLHVAKPGSDTRHHIDDIYLPNSDPDVLTSKIMNTTQEGYALLFRPGQAEITKSVEFINDHTGSNVIALPFYAKIGMYGGKDTGVRKFIEKIDGNLSKLRISKQDNIHERGDSLNVGSGRYTRCVIVATNIAEASITIDNLKYVIETGQQKKSIYDYNVRASTLQSVGIAESSRLQRRGRVGRTAPGKTYYTYEKNKMKDNKFLFDISVSDLTMDILDRMKDSSDESVFMNIDINKPITSQSLLELKNGYDDIIKHQYFVNGEFYSYIGNPHHYDYDNYENCALFYETGYQYSDVIDSDGKFYIIHPDELSFNRNINGEIVEILTDDVELTMHNDKLNRIKSKKMFSFLDNLLKSMLISFKNNATVKTNIGKHIHALYESLQNSESIESIFDVLLLIYSSVFNCTEIIIRYLSFRQALGNDMSKLMLFSETKRRMNKDDIQNIVKSKSSDIYALVELSIIIDESLRKNDITLNYKDNKYISKYDEDDKRLINQILHNETTEINYKKLEERLTDHVNNMYKSVENNIDIKLKTVCATLGLNLDVVRRYCRNYVMLKKQIDILQIKDPRRDTMTLKELGTHLSPLTNITFINDPVTFCLLLSKPYNIVKFITGTENKYLDVFNPTLMNIKSYSSLSKRIFIPKTLVSDHHLKSYMFYDNYDVNTKEISMTHKINPKSLIIVSHIFTLYELNTRYNKDHEKHSDWDNIKAVMNYTKTFNTIYDDLNKNRSTIIWSILPQIDESLTEYAKLMEHYEKYGNNNKTLK